MTFDLAIDGVTGNPADALRLAGSAGGQEELAIPVTIPEPSIASLLLLSSFVAGDSGSGADGWLAPTRPQRDSAW